MNVVNNIVLRFIEFYKIFISPLFFGGVCQYEVSCSEYAKKAILEFGVIQGSLLGVKRIWSCR